MADESRPKGAERRRLNAQQKEEYRLECRANLLKGDALVRRIVANAVQTEQSRLQAAEFEKRDASPLEVAEIAHEVSGHKVYF